MSEKDMEYDIEEIKATQEVKSTQRILDKKDFKIIKENGIKNWKEEEKEVVAAIELFINSKVKQAEDMLLKKYGLTLLHTHGLGVLATLKGLMTFDPQDIAYAMDSMKNTANASSALRKEASLISSFSGMLFGGAQKNRIAVISSMTFMERQVELCHAESYLLKALLSILTDSNFTTFLKEGLAIRQSYATYKSCYKFLAKTFAQGGTAALLENKVDSVFITGVYMGIGGFNLILSLLPERLLKIFEFIGFSGQLEFGMQCLAIGGVWPLNELLVATNRPTPKKRLKQKKAIDFYSDELPKETGCGTRKFMCETILHIYHVVIAGMIPVPACNIPIARSMADRGLSEYPESFLFLMVRGKISQTQRELSQAVTQLQRVIDVQKDWRQLAHVCFWEMGISYAAAGKYQEAADYFGILLAENEWSKGIYAYIRAVLLYEVDKVKHKAEIADLLHKVPTYMKKIAGKSIPLEKFVARKARKYFLQEERLLFPVLEILYIWNGFDLIPDHRLRLLVEELEHVLCDLDKQQEEEKKANGNEIPYSTFYDDLCLVRFFKGLATRELAYPSSDLLVPEVELVAKVITLEQKNQLEYAARQLEYISLQADEIEFDHWILPFARYELASLHVRMGDYIKARSDYDAALNGGYTDDEVGRKKKKASMETALHIKVHNSIMKLNFLRALRGFDDDMASQTDLLKKDSNTAGSYIVVSKSGQDDVSPSNSLDEVAE